MEKKEKEKKKQGRSLTYVPQEFHSYLHRQCKRRSVGKANRLRKLITEWSLAIKKNKKTSMSCSDLYASSSRAEGWGFKSHHHQGS